MCPTGSCWVLAVVGGSRAGGGGGGWGAFFSSSSKLLDLLSHRVCGIDGGCCFCGLPAAPPEVCQIS